MPTPSSNLNDNLDDLYGTKLVILQVYENKSHRYDPAKPSQGPQLIYETHLYIRYAPSFKRFVLYIDLLIH